MPKKSSDPVLTVLHTFKTNEGSYGGTVIKLHLGRWNDGPLVIEYREQYTDKASGELRWGKVRPIPLPLFNLLASKKLDVLRKYENDENDEKK